MAGRQGGSKEKILDAAEILTKEVGPAHLSLDAVAQRAGLSKGGLLYNFPTKAALLEALVERHIGRVDAALSETEASFKSSPNCLARAYVEIYRRECAAGDIPPSGVLAAIADNPGFIEPIRRYQRVLLDRMKEQSSDPELALLGFLAIEGLRCTKLLGASTFTDEEIAAATDKLAALLDGGPGPVE